MRTVYRAIEHDARRERNRGIARAASRSLSDTARGLSIGINERGTVAGVQAVRTARRRASAGS